MNQFRYRPSVINILLPLVGIVTMLISPLLARRRAAPMIPEEPQEKLTEEEAEKIAERALVKTKKAEKYVKEARRAVKPSGGGGIGRFIIPTIFVLAVRWLLMPPRRMGSTMMGAQTGGAQVPTGTRRMQQPQSAPMPPMPAEPERTLEPPERERPTGQPQVHSAQFDYPTARRETRAAAGVSQAPQGEPDDLKVIEGIGPSIARRLANHGITTFAALADADVQHIEEILREEGILQLSDPHTWPEQARLAANGQWDELDRLKRELKAGR